LSDVRGVGRDAGRMVSRAPVAAGLGGPVAAIVLWLPGLARGRKGLRLSPHV
jgi:hypothetical protein